MFTFLRLIFSSIASPETSEAYVGHPTDIKGAATGSNKEEAHKAYQAMRKHHDWKIVGEREHGRVFSLLLARSSDPLAATV